MFYSQLTNGFYDPDIHGDGIPADAVKITDGEHAALLAGQSSGKRIAPDSNGFPILVDPPPPTLGQVASALTASVQEHLDDVASSYGYDNVFTACTYADEPSVPRFQREGAAIRAWRSAVWAACHAVMDDVQAGHRQIPTASELIAILPELVMPT